MLYNVKPKLVTQLKPNKQEHGARRMDSEPRGLGLPGPKPTGEAGHVFPVALMNSPPTRDLQGNTNKQANKGKQTQQALLKLEDCHAIGFGGILQRAIVKHLQCSVVKQWR